MNLHQLSLNACATSFMNGDAYAVSETLTGDVHPGTPVTILRETEVLHARALPLRNLETVSGSSNYNSLEKNCQWSETAP